MTRKTLTPAPRRRGRPKTGEPLSETLQVTMPPKSVADLDRIVAVLRTRGETPTRSAAIRWAIRELVARLDTPRMARGLPVVSDGGPVTRP